MVHIIEHRQVASMVQACVDESRPHVSSTDVARAIQAAKLITCEIDTEVRVDRGDENWRGIVRASVVTPVRMRYGVDLESIDVDSFVFSPISHEGTGVMVITVPYPILLGTEIYSARERTLVEAEGLRLRSIGGEYYLGLARRDVADAARRLILKPADEMRVREITSMQIKSLIEKIIGDDVVIFVRFSGDET